jgi:uncharacterized membrane protein
MTEKILARASGRASVRPGDEIEARPDHVISYDFPGYTDVFFRETREEFGVEQVARPERFVLFIDHMVPAATPKEEELHRGTRAWGAAQGVPVVERKGIGHQVSAELGYATPGAFVVHFDGHVSQLGAFGVYAFGARKGVLEAYVSETMALRVPATIKIVLTGTLQPGVMARDVFHHLVRVMGPSSCAFKAVELAGPVIDAMSIEGRQTICGQAMFLGATTMLIAPDARTDAASFSPRAMLGDLMFIAAGTLWAGFGIVLRRHRLDPLLATAVISFSALLTYVPLYLAHTGGARLLAAAPAVLWTEVLVQGVIAGAGTLFTYAKMVSLLGPSRAAIFPALAPGLAALMAWPVLGHTPTATETGGLVVAMAGLLIAVAAPTTRS